MIHPDVAHVEISPAVGSGLVATKTIPRGTIVWCRDALDTVLDDTALARLPQALARAVRLWGYRDPDARWVLCWDAGRYMNHSCEPNVRGVGPNLQIAVRDISVGDEITCDYAECNLLEPFACACGSTRCRGQADSRIDPDWDRQVQEALAQALSVSQPLQEVFLEDHLLESLCAAVTLPTAQSLQPQPTR